MVTLIIIIIIMISSAVVSQKAVVFSCCLLRCGQIEYWRWVDDNRRLGIFKRITQS